MSGCRACCSCSLQRWRAARPARTAPVVGPARRQLGRRGRPGHAGAAGRRAGPLGAGAEPRPAVDRVLAAVPAARAALRASRSISSSLPAAASPCRGSSPPYRPACGRCGWRRSTSSTGPGLAARLCARLASQVVVQHRTCSARHRRAVERRGALVSLGLRHGRDGAVAVRPAGRGGPAAVRRARRLRADRHVLGGAAVPVRAASWGRPRHCAGSRTPMSWSPTAATPCGWRSAPGRCRSRSLGRRRAGRCATTTRCIPGRTSWPAAGSACSPGTCRRWPPRSRTIRPYSPGCSPPHPPLPRAASDPGPASVESLDAALRPAGGPLDRHPLRPLPLGLGATHASRRRLDLGVSDGTFTVALHREAKLDVVAVDAHADYPPRAARAEPHLPLGRVGTALPFASGAFDSVSAAVDTSPTRPARWLRSCAACCAQAGCWCSPSPRGMRSRCSIPTTPNTRCRACTGRSTAPVRPSATASGGLSTRRTGCAATWPGIGQEHANYRATELLAALSAVGFEPSPRGQRRALLAARAGAGAAAAPPPRPAAGRPAAAAGRPAVPPGQPLPPHDPPLIPTPVCAQLGSPCSSRSSSASRSRCSGLGAGRHQRVAAGDEIGQHRARHREQRATGRRAQLDVHGAGRALGRRPDADVAVAGRHGQPVRDQRPGEGPLDRITARGGGEAEVHRVRVVPVVPQ